MLLHVCTRGNQHKAHEENWPISGLKDHRYLSVTWPRQIVDLGQALKLGVRLGSLR